MTDAYRIQLEIVNMITLSLVQKMPTCVIWKNVEILKFFRQRSKPSLHQLSATKDGISNNIVFVTNGRGEFLNWNKGTAAAAIFFGT